MTTFTGPNHYISSNISTQLLTIGPNYKNHRGGVGAVIQIYSRYFEDFRFIETHKEGTPIVKIALYLKALLHFITKLIIRSEIKIIHIHGASYGSFYRKFSFFLIAKYLFNKKVIYHVHGAEYHLFYQKSKGFSKKGINFFINNADCVICLSQKWEDFFKTIFSPKKVVIVPNIIDYPDNSLVKTNTNELKFLFLGKVGQRKGVYDLLDVIHQKRSYYKGKVKLQIGGNGEVELLEKMIKEKDLTEMVEYIGWVSSAEKNRYLNDCDVYILPSYNEGLPISILEAMSYGKPIISTPVGGIPEIVIPGRNGFLVEPGNLKSIDEVITNCVENKSSLVRLGIESIAIVEKHFPKNVLKELSFIYNELLNNE